MKNIFLNMCLVNIYQGTNNYDDLMDPYQYVSQTKLLYFIVVFKLNIDFIFKFKKCNTVA